MKDFPQFMKAEENKVDTDQQNTKDVEGYVYKGVDGSQMVKV